MWKCKISEVVLSLQQAVFGFENKLKLFSGDGETGHLKHWENTLQHLSIAVFTMLGSMYAELSFSHLKTSRALRTCLIDESLNAYMKLNLTTYQTTKPSAKPCAPEVALVAFVVLDAIQIHKIPFSIFLNFFKLLFCVGLFFILLNKNKKIGNVDPVGKILSQSSEEMFKVKFY